MEVKYVVLGRATNGSWAPLCPFETRLTSHRVTERCGRGERCSAMCRPLGELKDWLVSTSGGGCLRRMRGRGCWRCWSTSWHEFACLRRAPATRHPSSRRSTSPSFCTCFPPVREAKGQTCGLVRSRSPSSTRKCWSCTTRRPPGTRGSTFRRRRISYGQDQSTFLFLSFSF